jgi:hypothetical protein
MTVSYICKSRSTFCLLHKATRHEDVCFSGDIAPPFLTSILDGDEWLASRPCRFTSTETVPIAHCVGVVVCPRAVLDATEKGKSHTAVGNGTQILDHPTHSLVTTPTELSSFPEIQKYH